MAAQVVALDRDLSRLGGALQAAGFRVVAVDDGKLAAADVVVLDGLDDRIMGMATTPFPAPIVDATGLTPSQVVAAVRRHLAP